MIANATQVCLYKPEIPQNTGAIARLVAGSCSRLHLIKPFGFELNDKNVRRAGLDYWPYLDMEIHKSLDELLLNFDNSEIAIFTKFAQKDYRQMEPSVRLLIFGQETKGLPESFRTKNEDRCFSLPLLHPEVRSLNLANSVSIALYHQMFARNLNA